MDADRRNRTKAAWILGGIAMVEGSWVLFNASVSGARFWRYLGFASGRSGDWPGWVLATLVVGAFVALSMRLPSVRAHLIRVSWLKLLGLLVAVAAGILEEAIFRKKLMDVLQQVGFGGVLQIVASAAAFGLVHGVWGLFGRSVRAAIGATVATAVLGGALALVYLAAGRSVLPCIAAHFVINALVEPGLVLAAARGEMGRPRDHGKRDLR